MKGRLGIDNVLKQTPEDRVRRKGAGRPPVEKKDEQIENELLNLVEDQAGSTSVAT